MIWLWITVAVFITLVLLRKKNIAFHHFIWVLIPIDFYGITLLGVTIKPYMIFSFFLLFRNMLKNRGSLKLRVKCIRVVILLFLLSLMFLSDILNNSGIPSLMQHFMFILVFVCALIYISSIKSIGEIVQIKYVIVATTLGFGLVYLFAIIVYYLGFSINGIVTSDRFEPGIMIQFINTGYARLRGFLIDPNTLAASILPATVISIHQLFKELRGKSLYVAQIIISLICIYFTNSRTAIACYMFIVVLSVASGIKYSSNKKIISFFSKLAWVSCFILVIMVVFESSILVYGFQKITQPFEGRAYFNDDFGRGTLWKESWSVFAEKSIFWGVGQGLVQNYTSTFKGCHNTWLEWIVGSGIISGTFIDIYFLSLLFPPPILFKASIDFHNASDFSSIRIGYLSICIILSTVDNITNSNLIFFSCLIMLLISQLHNTTKYSSKYTNFNYKLLY